MKQTMNEEMMVIDAEASGMGDVDMPLEGKRVKRRRIARVRKPVDVGAYVALEDAPAGAAPDATDAEVLSLSGEAAREEALQLYVEAAWRFGKSVIWKDHAEDEQEQRVVMGALEDFFRSAADPQEAFVQFVARVLKAEANKKRCPILRPLRWMLQAQEDGLLKMDPKSLGGEGSKSPVVGKVARVLAKHFLAFVKEPSVRTFLSCSEELEAVGGKGWMRVFFG